MKWRSGLLLVLTLGAACNRAPSTGSRPPDVVEFDRKSRTFAVDPLTNMSWIQSFTAEFRCNPSCNAAGETRISIEPHFSYMEPSSGPCSMTSVHVIVHTVVVTPEWDSPSASTNRRNWWRDIQTRIVAHERRHVSIADEYGRMLADSLQAIRPTNCTDLRAEADQMTRRMMQMHQDQQDAFDLGEGPLHINPPPPS